MVAMVEMVGLFHTHVGNCQVTVIKKGLKELHHLHHLHHHHHRHHPPRGRLPALLTAAGPFCEPNRYGSAKRATPLVSGPRNRIYFDRMILKPLMWRDNGGNRGWQRRGILVTTGVAGVAARPRERAESQKKVESFHLKMPERGSPDA